MSGLDLTPLWLTLKVAGLTVVILLLVSLPIAWWLAFTRSRFKVAVEACTALPLVLPPTVMGFYLLILFGPEGAAGELWTTLTGQPLVFTFAGLVAASCVYSLPFVVQPLQAALETMDRRTMEAAWTLGASRWRTFVIVVLPQIRRGLLTALVLGFAHTLGEFGVVLMVGGNIPGETQMISIAIYEQVELLDYTAAHAWSLGLLLFSFVILVLVYGLNRRWHTEMKL